MAIRVLIVDDSAVMRSLLTELIGGGPDLTVVGAAPDPLAAREMIKSLNPDVLTLDVEMPKMDGLDFLERLMRLRPMPVLMISTLTEKGSETTLRALELGAVDFLAKPGRSVEILDYGEEIREKIRAAHQARIRARPRQEATSHRKAGSSVRLDPRTIRERLILIGASTGGTEAIKDVLTGLPGGCPPVLMVQHMPEMFTGSFARRLDSLCELTVKEAEHGEALQPGVAYLAPGHSHLLLVKRGGVLRCELSRSEPVNRHRPAVDVLFESAAPLVGAQAVAALLTGMGKDGAKGLLSLKRAGAWTIAQDEASCVVYGMPREAAAIGATSEIVGLKDVAAHVLRRLAGDVRRIA
ncbi:MAG: chemotaxis response regulator protein-glutamate methylesterase [Rhodocyclaceae bacterium]|nr:chemotaxis response regulator protein-glutamate methylesterase [Rhodocyclaceae bacterium]